MSNSGAYRHHGNATTRTHTEISISSLPPLNGMASAEKIRCVEIVRSHASSYTVPCVRQLVSEMHIPLAVMQNLRICLELAEDHPDHQFDSQSKNILVESLERLMSDHAPVIEAALASIDLVVSSK